MIEYTTDNVSKCIISQPIPKGSEIGRSHCGLHRDLA